MESKALKKESVDYWDDVATSWQETRTQPLWRRQSDRLHTELFSRWLRDTKQDRILKTDLFDESLTDGVFPLLTVRATSVVGIDLSPAIIQAVRSRHPAMHAIVSDVRNLPFESTSFDAIISNSTLDHFYSKNDIQVSLQEFQRILKPGGQLLLTLDNPINPLIAIRNAMPFKFLNRLGILPYFVGATCGPREIQKMLATCGFDITETTAIWHFPRIIAVRLSQLLENKTSSTQQTSLMRFFSAFEKMGKWPSRYITGYFVAVQAVKR